MINCKIRSALVEATEFPELADRYSVYAVPKIVIDGAKSIQFEGAYPEQMFLAKVKEALA
jgi:hypothetical protein